MHKRAFQPSHSRSSCCLHLRLVGRKYSRVAAYCCVLPRPAPPCSDLLRSTPSYFVVFCIALPRLIKVRPPRRQCHRWTDRLTGSLWPRVESVWPGRIAEETSGGAEP
ncbi:unnamed protein product [Protopolystoma xenopodis]|uniref:Uncharacterized protein n=1 Tax=Protopolystoma xenopodis TaxID=117903 RepID=A0A3S5CHE1_9PLAT|nr:unnamed protein product [Protopolystoma xenopodis]